MSSKKKKNTFRDRTISLLQTLEGMNSSITRNIQRGQINIRVLPTTRAPQSIIDKIRKDVEDRVPKLEFKKTFEKSKETTWEDIIDLIWKNKDLIQLVGKDIFKGMTEEEIPPMSEEKEDVADRDEGKHDGGFHIDVGEIKLSPLQRGEIKPDVSIGRLERNIPETEFSVITEFSPMRNMGILNILKEDVGEIKRAITDNAQVQISQFNRPFIQADVTENDLTYPFFVGLQDQRYPVNAPIHAIMADYPNINLVDLYGLQLERLTDSDLESL